MSGFEVWLFLVFIPKLCFPLYVAGTISMLFLIFGWLAYSALTEPRKIHSYDKQMNLRTKVDDSLRVRYAPLMIKLTKLSLIISITCPFVSATIPDKKEIAAIIAIPYVTNNKEFKKIPENLAKKLNNYLSDYAQSAVKGE